MKRLKPAIKIMVFVFLLPILDGCRAKGCYDYDKGQPSGFKLFKQKHKTQNGLFTKKQRRY